MSNYWDEDMEEEGLEDDEDEDFSLSDDEEEAEDDGEDDEGDAGEGADSEEPLSAEATESEYDGPPRSKAELEKQFRRRQEAQREEAEARKAAVAEAEALRAERDGDVPKDEELVLGVPDEKSRSELRAHTEFLREELASRQAEGDDWMVTEGGEEPEPEPFDFFSLSDEDFADVVAAAKGAPVKRRSRLDDEAFGRLLGQFGPGARPGSEAVEDGEEF